MGLSSKELELTIRLARDRVLPRESRVAEIGAQQLSNDFLASTGMIDELGKLRGAKGKSPLPPAGQRQFSSTGAEIQPDNAPRSEVFWKWLGFGYTAIDVDNSPGTIALDLNFDSVPAPHVRQYDLVINAGTTEHVANQVNAMKIIHDLTKVGGVMIHRLPGQGFTNHGLVNYNLKFFWMLARSNLYTWSWMDFETTKDMRPIDPDIVATLKQFNPPSVPSAEAFRLADCAVTVALKKVIDIEFVPPLDVRTGEEVNVEVLKQRYWTVFDRPRVERTLKEHGL